MPPTSPSGSTDDEGHYNRHHRHRVSWQSPRFRARVDSSTEEEDGFQQDERELQANPGSSSEDHHHNGDSEAEDNGFSEEEEGPDITRPAARSDTLFGNEE